MNEAFKAVGTESLVEKNGSLGLHIDAFFAFVVCMRRAMITSEVL